MTKVTVKELREQAKVAGIKGYSRMRKAELEAALSEPSGKISEEVSKGKVTMKEKRARAKAAGKREESRIRKAKMETKLLRRGWKHY